MTNEMVLIVVLLVASVVGGLALCKRIEKLEEDMRRLRAKGFPE